MKSIREQSRDTFNATAGQYDKVRPSYPEALVDDVLALSKIPDGGRILEIGCGTGKATELFATKGYSMDCLDLGIDLASVAAAKFSHLDNVRIIVKSFEDWDPFGARYDLVIAATSIHWVDPQIRFTKCASVLRPQGVLAAFTNEHVRIDDGFFVRVQDVYRTHAPSMTRVAADREKLWQQKEVGQELFNKPIVRRYPWTRKYDAEEYIALLGTYSDHLSLPEDEKTPLFSSIRRLIRDEFGGYVRKHYDAVLTLRTLRESPDNPLQATPDKPGA